MGVTGVEKVVALIHGAVSRTCWSRSPTSLGEEALTGAAEGRGVFQKLVGANGRVAGGTASRGLVLCRLAAGG